MTMREFCRSKYSLKLEVATSIVLDNILTTSTKKECVPAVCFADIDGFIREEEISRLERKFYLAIQVHTSKISGATGHLISLYVTKEKDAIITKALDPMTMKTYYMKTFENVRDLVLPKERGEVCYTSARHPKEEGAFWRFCNRLSLLTVANKTYLTSSEQKKFVDHLRKLVQESNLPFFVTVNDLCVAFEVDRCVTSRCNAIVMLLLAALENH